MQRTDQPAEALLQRDYGGRNLILKKCVAAVGVRSAFTRAATTGFD